MNHKRFLGFNYFPNGLLGMNVGTLLAPMMFLTVQEQIICIDDIERKSKDLRVEDVLGLISFLREQRRCKGVLVLNEEKLGKDGESFKLYLEKVVDKAILFAPTAEEAAMIVLNMEQDAYLRRCCIALEIRNVRVIQRVKELSEEMRAKMRGRDTRIIEDALTAVAVLCWIAHLPDEAPDLAFLKGRAIQRTQKSLMMETDSKTESWHAKLDQVGFYGLNEVGEVVSRAIMAGYIDDAAINTALSEAENSLEARDLKLAYGAAWEKFRSLEHSEEQVISGLTESFKAAIDCISLYNLDDQVALYKELGRAHEAEELIRYFDENRLKSRETAEPYLGGLSDPDVRKVLSKGAPAPKEELKAKDLLDRINSGSGIERLAADRRLAATGLDEFIKLFKTRDLKDIEIIVSECAYVARKNPEEGNSMRERVRSALEKLADSNINKLRLKKAMSIINEKSA